MGIGNIIDGKSFNGIGPLLMLWGLALLSENRGERRVPSGRMLKKKPVGPWDGPGRASECAGGADPVPESGEASR